MNCKLAGREQLAAQGVSGRQVHKGVAGGSQRRGSVASHAVVLSIYFPAPLARYGISVVQLIQIQGFVIT